MNYELSGQKSGYFFNGGNVFPCSMPQGAEYPLEIGTQSLDLLSQMCQNFLPQPILLATPSSMNKNDNLLQRSNMYFQYQLHPINSVLMDPTSKVSFAQPNLIPGAPVICKKKNRVSWSRDECIKMLQCTKLMLDCDLKTITKAIYCCINRQPGKSSGRAAEKKLKRLISFKNWKACNKKVVAKIIDKKLRLYQPDAANIDPHVRNCCEHFKEQYVLERGLFEQGNQEQKLALEPSEQ